MDSQMTDVRVYLAEDHTIVREGLSALLASHDDITVVGEAADGRTAVREVAQLKPDVVVMDLGLPELNGGDATRQICDIAPSTRVLVLSMHSGEEYVRPAIRAGARGYLIKGSGLSDLVAAIRSVATGEAFFSPSVAKVLLSTNSQDSRGTGLEAEGQQLTGREREILQLVAEGKSTAEVAKLLALSVKTIEGYRTRIASKLGIKNVAGFVHHAIRLGLVSVDTLQ